MPPPPDPGSSADNGTPENLFVEADADKALTAPPAESSSAMETSAARRPRRGRGLVMPVEGQDKPPPPPPPRPLTLATQDRERSRL
jgi:hypothetical protein